ncbi:unnamed protein product [Brachionus calyciflorus]|uniref:TTF-type domain-containing protein n=1 Tax=Brachionus calyciflorus TaxID=104777 RepID=A0A813VD88_9BILA|nr:unnamed protein product [Brachionus calyciflorus]
MVFFQTSWYLAFNWIDYNEEKYLVFCFCCKNFGFGAAKIDTFVQSGFNKWKNAIEKFKEHEKSNGTSDISRHEQISICFRYCNDDLTVKEKFIGFFNEENPTGEMLYNVVKEVFLENGLDFKNLIAQCYDGASNMNGEFKGLANRVKSVSPTAYAHRLTLALQDSCESIKEDRNTLGQTNSIYNLIQGSSKRNLIFEKFQINTEKSSLSLKNLCNTRWASRYNTLKALNENYIVILDTLQVNKSFIKNRIPIKIIPH